MTKGEKIKKALEEYYKNNKPWNYNGVKDKVVFCLDCKKQISCNAKKCNSCAQKGKKLSSEHKAKIGLKKENHPLWKGGMTRLPFCECGKQLSRIDAMTCQFCYDRIGKNNPRFLDGRTSIRKCIYNLKETTVWRTKCFKRDSYTCQECGQIGGKLEVDHIKQFSEILNKFLNKYNQFSLLEDKDTLVRLSISYKPFWNLNNGRTLCKSCHKKKKVDFKYSVRGKQ